MNAFTVVFLLALAAGAILRVWLATRQALAVASGSRAVPTPFVGRVTLEAHQRAAAYTAAHARFSVPVVLIETAVLLGWTVLGGLQALDDAWRFAGLPSLVIGIGVLLSVVLLDSLPATALAAYRTFVIEARFGFNRTTPALFLADHSRQAFLTLAFGLPLAAAVLLLVEHAGPTWWLFAWLVFVAFSLLVIWAYPAFLAPLFNRFTPLADTTLRDRVDALLRRCGFSASGVYVMDGSRRSAHGNAYFTGFGNKKRIVFFDTLLDTLSPAEVEAVLAHELGHYRLHHVLKNLALTAAISLGAFALLGWLRDSSWFYHGLGVDTVARETALALFLLVAPVFAFFPGPALAALSRRFEAEADAYAAARSDATALLAAMLTLYRDNAATLTPDPLYSAVYDSHPPPPVRVARLERLARASSDQP
ncbi:MAG: M48 family metallopeptidase [Dehalococcoidia bacterium]|nr:M48 family metallopeptidase [Dehalococcoidia bacterium]